VKVLAMIEPAARWLARLGGLVILTSAVLIGFELLSRNLGLGIKFHAFDLTNYGFAAATAFGFAYALTQRAHIRIDVIYQWVPVPVRAMLDLLSLLLLLVMASGMAWYAWRVVAYSARLGARPNSTLDIPLALPQAIWAIGLSAFALISVLMALRLVLRLVRGGPGVVHAEFGVGSDSEGLR